MIEYSSIQPFIPSGKDYDLARRFFAEIGFVELWESDGMAGFQCGDCRFFLQRYDNEAFAQNLMIKLVVPNLDSWWAVIQPSRWKPSFPRQTKATDCISWGREVNIIDPAGVCWHVMGQ